MKIFMQSSLSLIFMVFYSGCTLIHMGQESVEKIKVVNTHGYQNGIEPKNIRNVKDYLVDENDVVILAENSHKTVLKLRNTELYGRLDMISDAADYCEEKGGKVRYGKQVASFIASKFDSIDFEFSSVKSNFKKKRQPGYKGWMKCINTEDNFEILRKSRTNYFVVTHEKEQLQGYSMRWFIDYSSLNETDPNSLKMGAWNYNTLIRVTSLCVVNEGEASISNRYTQKKKIDLNSYFIQRLDPRNGKKPYLLAQGEFSCKNGKKEEKNFIFDISYSQKYRTLIYTKRL